jgi:hypothetical protein
MLQIRVHRDHEIAARRGEARLQGGRLAEVAAQLHDAKSRLGGNKALGYFQGAVGAAIVDQNEFEGVAGPSARRGHEPGRKFAERRGLVVNGRDDTDEHQGRVPTTVQLYPWRW